MNGKRLADYVKVTGMVVKIEEHTACKSEWYTEVEGNERDRAR